MLTCLKGLENRFQRRDICHYSPNGNDTYRYSVSLQQPVTDTFIKKCFPPAFTAKMPKIPSLISTTTEDLRNKVPATQIFKRNILRLAKYGIPCPCCGYLMLDIKRFNRFKRQVEKTQNSRELIKHVSTYKKFLHPIEKNIFEMLDKETQKTPDKSLLEILQSKLKPAEDTLIQEQSAIFTNIAILLREQPKETKAPINNLINETYQMILGTEPTSKFSRKIFIDKIDALTQQISPKIRRSILDNAISLPTAYNNQNAFIVKYSKYNYKQQNPNQFIATRLLSNSLATLEHIKPKNFHGDNSPKNLALECACDNNRRHHYSLKEQIKQNPMMPLNYKKYIRCLVQLVQQGKVEESYVIHTNRTFGELSNGILYEKLPNKIITTTNQTTKKELQNKKKRVIKKNSNHKKITLHTSQPPNKIKSFFNNKFTRK